MSHEEIIDNATTWAKVYLGTQLNVPRLHSLIMGYVMGAGIDQVAKQEIITELAKRERSGYHYLRG